MEKISLPEIKQALMDPRFRDSLPFDMKEDIAKYLTNPSCACNVPLYRKILKSCVKEIKAYFPGKEIAVQEEVRIKPKNNFSVINCHINELEERLRKTAPGRKQIAITRYQDQVTAIINELE